MVTAYLFDRRQGGSVEDWAESLDRLGENQILWIDLMDASEDETAAAASPSFARKRVKPAP